MQRSDDLQICLHGCYSWYVLILVEDVFKYGYETPTGAAPSGLVDQAAYVKAWIRL